MKNQCDGCRRGLPLTDGIHYGKGYDMIGCTKNRYTEQQEMFEELSRIAQKYKVEIIVNGKIIK